MKENKTIENEKNISGTELIQRYIYAIEKRLRSKNRKEIHQELQALIDDSYEAKFNKPADEISYEEAKIVLTELGTPSELAVKYDDDNVQALITQPWYSTYKWFLRLILLVVAFGMSIAIIPYTIENHISLTEAIIKWIADVFGGLTTGFSFVTIGFAVLQRKNIKVNGFNDNLDELQPIPPENERIKNSDVIVGMVISLIFVLIFLTCNNFFRVIITEKNINLPIFNAVNIQKIWYLIMISWIISLIKDISKLIEGSYTLRVSVISIICSIGSAILAYFIILRSKIFNTEFLNILPTLFEDKDAAATNVLMNVDKIFLLAVLLAIIVEIIVAVCHAIKSRDFEK